MARLLWRERAVKLLLSGVLAVAGLVAAPTAASAEPRVTIRVAPPAPRVEVVPAPPTPRHVWTRGYWTWTGRHHVWVPGRYVQPRPQHVWREPRWERRDRGHWHFHRGYWHHR